MSRAPSVLHPGAAGWERAGSGAPQLRALASAELRWASFPAPGGANDDELAGLARFELERLGADLDGGGRSWDCARAGPDWAIAWALADEHADAAPKARRWEPAARLFPEDGDTLSLRRELGRWTLAIWSGGALAHAQCLAAPRPGAAMAAELRRILTALELRGAPFSPRRIMLRSDDGAAAASADALSAALDRRVEASITRPITPPAAPSRLLPPAAARFRGGRRTRRIALAALAVLLLALVAALGAYAWETRRIASRAAADRAWMSAHTQEVEAIRAARARWMGVEAATDPDAYPAEAFHRIGALLPARGLRLTSFEMDGPRLIVEAEAADMHAASRLGEAIEGSPQLARWRWSVPPPRERRGGRVALRAEGRLLGSEEAP